MRGQVVRWYVLTALLLVGLVWLGRSAAGGLGRGDQGDLHRRWVSSQYVRAGINPYPLALAALELRHGPLDSVQLSRTQIHVVPRRVLLQQEDSGVPDQARPFLEAHGTPEATYPPSTEMFQSLTLGLLPETWVTAIGVLGNLLLLGLCAWLLTLHVPVDPGRDLPKVVLGTLLFLFWAPVHSCVLATQYSLLVLASLLLAIRLLKRHSLAAGLLLTLALLKPTMSLPFLILPLLRRRWLALALPLGIHAAATLIQAACFGCSPWVLMGQWLQVGGYFSFGMFTIQEVVIALRLDGSLAGKALPLLLLLGCWAWCWWNREVEDEQLFDLLCVFSALWTYHGTYDFVLFLVPLARRVLSLAPPWRSLTWWIAAGSLVLLSVALSNLVRTENHWELLRGLRLLARVVLALWLAGLALGLLLSVRRPRTRIDAGRIQFIDWRGVVHANR